MSDEFEGSVIQKLVDVSGGGNSQGDDVVRLVWERSPGHTETTILSWQVAKDLRSQLDILYSSENESKKCNHKHLSEGATFTCPNCGYKYELSAKTLGPTKDSEKAGEEPEKKPESPEIPKPDSVEAPSPETAVAPGAPKESRFTKALDTLCG